MAGTGFPERGWFEAWRRAVAADAELGAIVGRCSLDLALVADGEMVLLRVREGLISEFVPDPGMADSWSVTLRGGRDDGLTFLQPEPPPFYNDMLAMYSRVLSFSIEGDRRVFVRHMRCLTRLFRVAQLVDAMPEFDPIVGRYVYVEGVRNRVYFEEVGTGVPLLCLHTAGADSRQYRHLLCDADITSRWRVISCALGLQRLVILGCSMGGAIGLELARKHAGEVGAVIRLEAASKVEGRFSDWKVMPDVDGSVVATSWTYDLMAPQSPEVCRREVWWHYGQGGPGVYRGDTYFYSVDWDLRGREEEIDVSECPVYLLTGEYDHDCSAGETEETARAIRGVRFAKMRGFGHFPMAENYRRFKEYLLPILGELEDQRTAAP